MKRLLSEQQLAQSYLDWRQQPPRTGRLLRKYFLLWAVMVLLVSALVMLADLLIERIDIRWLTPLAIGLVLGAILRDIGWTHRFVSTWPMLNRLLDWPVVEKLAARPLMDSEKTGLPKTRPVRAVMIGIAAAVVLLSALFGSDQILLRMHDPRTSNPANQVVIYTTAWCPYCEVLRQHLQRSKIPYQERDVEKSFAASYEHRAVGGRGIPVTLVGQEVVHGLQDERIDGLLRDAGYEPSTWPSATQSASNPHLTPPP